MKKTATGIYFFFICTPVFLLSINTVDCQTLTNLPVLQGKRSEINIGKLASLFKGSNQVKFEPPKPDEKDKRQSDELVNWRVASLYARDNPGGLSRLLEAYLHSSDFFTLSPQSGEKNKNLFYAILAVQDGSVIEQYFIDNGFAGNSPERNKVENEIRFLENAVKKISSPTISVFASGNIRGVAASTSPEPTTTGTGTLGATYASSKHVFSAQISIASTLDSTKSGFGSLLLAPSNGKSLKSAQIEWYPEIGWPCKDKSWLHMYWSFASSLWEIQKDSIYRNASSIGLGALYHHRLFGGLIAETKVGLDIEFGLAARWLDGDIRNLLKAAALSEKFLSVFPTKKNFFMGFETGLTLNFGQVVGALQAYYLFPKKDEPVDGLSGLQISVGLSVRGDIIRGILTDD